MKGIIIKQNMEKLETISETNILSQLFGQKTTTDTSIIHFITHNCFDLLQSC